MSEKTITEETIELIGHLLNHNGPGAIFGILSAVESDLFTQAANIDSENEFEAGKLEALASMTKTLKQEFDHVADRLGWER